MGSELLSSNGERLRGNTRQSDKLGAPSGPSTTPPPPLDRHGIGAKKEAKDLLLTPTTKVQSFIN